MSGALGGTGGPLDGDPRGGAFVGPDGRKGVWPPGTVRHRNEVVEYRVEQHRTRLEARFGEVVANDLLQVGVEQDSTTS
jgi:hypothetical protein